MITDDYFLMQRHINEYSFQIKLQCFIDKYQDIVSGNSVQVHYT